MIVLIKFENQKYGMRGYSRNMFLQINPLLRESCHVVDGSHVIKTNDGVHSLELVGDTFGEVEE